MKKFERVIVFLMIIPIVLFTIETFAYEQKEEKNVNIAALKMEYLSGVVIKDYSSWQKYYNKSFRNNSSGSKGTIDIQLIELYSKDPDEGSLNYTSAWYSQDEGGTEPFYGKHFNYEGGVYKLRLRNHNFSINTYKAEGTWYVSY